MRLFRMLSSSVALAVICLPVLGQESPPPRGREGAPPPPTRTPREPRAPRDPNAQRPAGRPNAPGALGTQRNPLSPEQSKAAWELEAGHTAKTIGLNETQTKQTVAAYIEARQSHAAAMEKMREEIMEKAREAGEEAERDPAARTRPGGMGAQMRQPMIDLHKGERAKLEAALAKSLSPDQVGQALGTLGTFNPVWDAMVITLTDLKLDPAKNEAAMTAVHGYVAALGKEANNEDREAVRTSNQEANRKIRETMQGFLTEEQFSQFQRFIPGGARPAGARGEGAGTRPGRGEGAAGGRGGEGAPGGAAGGGRGGRGGDGGTP